MSIPMQNLPWWNEKARWKTEDEEQKHPACRTGWRAFQWSRGKTMVATID
jgi:hypothetical protein